MGILSVILANALKLSAALS